MTEFAEREQLVKETEAAERQSKEEQKVAMKSPRGPKTRRNIHVKGITYLNAGDLTSGEQE